MSSLGPISTALEAELRKQVQQNGIVIWLDRDGHYTELVDRLQNLRAEEQLPYAVHGFRGSLGWVPFTGQFQPLASLTPDGRNRVRSEYRPHGEFCLSGSCAVLHGSTSTESGPG